MIYIWIAMEAFVSAIAQTAYLIHERTKLTWKESVKEWRQEKKFLLISFAAQLILLIVLVGISYNSSVQTVLWRRMLLLPFLWILAWKDLQEHILPNRIILTALIVRVILLAVEIISYPELWMNQLVYFLIGAGGCFFVMLVLYLVTKHSLGEGDVKLYALMGAYLGFNNTINILLLSLFLVGIFGVLGVAGKKLSWKSQLPIGPFSLAGFVLFYSIAALGGIRF